MIKSDNYSVNGRKLVIFENVTEIKESEFENAEFTEIEIKTKGNLKICANAFKNCKNLRFITFTNNPKIEVMESAFEGLEELIKVEYGIFTKIEKDAFKNCKKLDCIYLAFATYISDTAFDGCDNFFVMHYDVEDNEYLKVYVDEREIPIE